MLNRHNWALILVNTAFQMGFCTFVLSNYMKTLPYEIYESAQARRRERLAPVLAVDHASGATGDGGPGYLAGHLDLQRVLWATVLISKGECSPVTSALNNLRGQFFADTNLVAAGSIIVALPVLIVFFVLQKQFVAGLTLGSTKG